MSAGFAEYRADTNSWFCFGESESMGVRSLKEDSDALTLQLTYQKGNHG